MDDMTLWGLVSEASLVVKAVMLLLVMAS
ncbi:MAG TPA: protein TolQ, partial [Alcanivorax sp.]|nr:protein TolQ [Alcanivorax sp.]